jgi:hypothetical protein
VTDQANPFDTPPIGLRPIYSTSEVNQSVELHVGPLQVSQNGLTLTGEGVIRLVWLPRPRFWFHLHLRGDGKGRAGSPSLGPRKAALRLVATSQEAEVLGHKRVLT